MGAMMIATISASNRKWLIKALVEKHLRFRGNGDASGRGDCRKINNEISKHNKIPTRLFDKFRKLSQLFSLYSLSLFVLR
jgi:hypothetical protein